jgi:hypothetical protein
LSPGEDARGVPEAATGGTPVILMGKMPMLREHSRLAVPGRLSPPIPTTPMSLNVPGFSLTLPLLVCIIVTQY